MADETRKQTDAARAADEAHKADVKAREAQEKADAAATDAGKTKEQVAADKAHQAADDKRAAAEQARTEEEAGTEATTAAEAKALSALREPDRAVGDHHAQKFANTPENPQLAPGLDPDAEGKVKLVLTTSDTLAVGEPAVAYVHPEMVGDYLRAGWTRG